MFDDSLHKHEEYKRNFEHIQRKFAASLCEKSGFISKYGFVHSFPLVVDKEDNEEYKEFYETLMKVVRRIVLNYHEDKDIQKIISIPDSGMELLNCCIDRDYFMGTLRPDFLIDKKGNFKMNEINARFPFNGYFLSYYLNAALKNTKEFKKDGFSSLSEIDRIPKSFQRIFGNSIVIKDSEGDWDISFYWEYLKEKGKDFFRVNPRELKIKHKCFFGDKNLEAIVLELKQREILEHFSKEHVKVLFRYPHLNDLRTILIAHDKRLLSVLYNEKMLNRYSTKEEREVISSHLIETYAINQESDMKARFVRDKDEWVLKQALKGKSKELWIGSETSKESWKKACDYAKSGPFVMQRKIDEKEFNIYFPHLRNFKMPVFGMFLGIDGKFISQGCYRGKAYDPTGLWDGYVSMPCAVR